MNPCLAKLGITNPSLNRQTEVVLRTELGLQVEEADILGSGSFGSVYSARRSRNPNEQVVCKFFQPLRIKSHDLELWKSFADEANAYRHIQSINNRGCTNIVQFECDFQIIVQYDSNDNREVKLIKNAAKLDELKPPVGAFLYGLVVEKVDYDFNDWFMAAIAFDHEQIALELFRQIGSVLQSIHSKHNLCHQDLKMDNFGVVRSSDRSFPTVKLLDFGLAQVYDNATFEKAETKCAKTFSIEQDVELIKVQDEYEFCCQMDPFTKESFKFGRILVDVVRKLYGDSDKLMDKLQNKRFRRLVIALANAQLTISSAIAIAKSEGIV